MKILFTALNAKYIHVNLALKCIAKYCKKFSPVVKEYTINDNIDAVIADIYSQNADVIAFSCYIWSIEKILYIAECIKKVNPGVFIVLGGHEVSYDSEEVLKNNKSVDCIIRGEGEKPMFSLLSAYEKGGDFKDVPSLTYRKNGEILQNPLCESIPLDDYEFMYDDSIKDYKGKILYYESSRGCPYKCSYCLSSNSAKVNFLSLERVKKELMFFIKNKVPLVKFVDRTFNADRKRANEIFKFIIENREETKFHFELAGNLIDDEMIEILKDTPENLIQFEIGVQSTNEKTINAIGRNIDFLKVASNVKKILDIGTIHIHLDLIAGLPYETLDIFKKSFNDVLKIRPHMLQLGFLKLLKGSRIRNEKDKFGYKFKSKAPYEVMANDFISFDELIVLKRIESVLDRYYNSGDFKYTIDYLFKKYDSYYEIFEKIADYYEKNSLFKVAVSHDGAYDVLLEIFDDENIKDYVKADRLLNKKAKLIYDIDEDFKQKCFEVLKNKEFSQKYLPHYKDSATKKIFNLVRFEKLFGKVFLYDNKNNTLTDVTGDFASLTGEEI